MEIKTPISISLEDKLIFKRLLLLTTAWFFIAIESIASQSGITGSDLYDLIVQRLSQEGIHSKPFIKKNRVFTGCTKNDIVVSKRDTSWKTLQLNCKTNKSWAYNFRNKVIESSKREVSGSVSHRSTERMHENTKLVYILKNQKSKGDRIEASDLVLSSKRKILSKGAFDDLTLVLGRRTKKSLKVGEILKERHLGQDWLVHKNQQIKIENKFGEIYVTMEGIALSNGVKGDRILVRNISSNKVIEGFVKSEKKISIFRKLY